MASGGPSSAGLSSNLGESFKGYDPVRVSSFSTWPQRQAVMRQMAAAHEEVSGEVNDMALDPEAEFYDFFTHDSTRR
eukprot:CAMPEP_0182901330 /NCGR_PEP_ID=MMETSP0034_2-20130328/29574_1 /TAXON_ID=156128 /ORGANISM="Nephroselmis pyriformis, Strain CCMP717" /LENGTH=76 /DNA_ID=CAMNT_0025035731 /DNA_START=1 /DNA_END=228 /DNA_ORIENTATION=-